MSKPRAIPAIGYFRRVRHAGGWRNAQIECGSPKLGQATAMMDQA
jgi:hypothetical protein